MVSIKKKLPIEWKSPIDEGAFFLPFVKFIKVFDEKYFMSRNPNKEIIFFWTKV